MFVPNNEKKIGRQYQKRRKNMRISGLFYFSSNDVLKRSRLTSYALLTVGLVKMKS